MAACWSVCTVIIAESMVLIADSSEAKWSCETVGATTEAARSCAGCVEFLDSVDSVVPGGCL